MNRIEGEAFLDGYRHGLGTSIRIAQAAADDIAAVGKSLGIDMSSEQFLLARLAATLRVVSASVVLSPTGPVNDE